MSIQDLINQATKDVDHTETTSAGDFEYTPPEAGVTVGVFIGYIELGKQKQPDYQGKPKPDAEEVRMVFALTHPKKNLKEIEVEGGTKKIQEHIAFNITLKLGEKAKFKKVFNAMRYGRDGITHMAQMLGEKFLLTITHSTSEKTKKGYANLWNEAGEIGIKAPRQEDALSGTVTDLRPSIPDALEPLKVFFFDNPTKETWDSLFVDGTRTVKGEDGKEVEKSKNWLQERIMSASNYKGSALEVMLSGIGNLHTEAQKHSAGTTIQEHEELDLGNGAGSVQEKQTEHGASPTRGTANNAAPSPSDADDALKALGLS